MLDAKNTFLINISVSNKTKDRFYSQSVPEIEDVSDFKIIFIIFCKIY